MRQTEISAQKVLDASAGMLQKQLYVVFTKPVRGLEPVMENLSAHLKYQVELERSGVMFGAGPLWSDDERHWLGEGMVIIRADSRSDAENIAAADPMHVSGARRFTVRPWLLNEGTVTIKISYSDGKREII